MEMEVAFSELHLKCVETLQTSPKVNLRIVYVHIFQTNVEMSINFVNITFSVRGNIMGFIITAKLLPQVENCNCILQVS
jgi:hypothetical protein